VKPVARDPVEPLDVESLSLDVRDAFLDEQRNVTVLSEREVVQRHANTIYEYMTWKKTT